MCGRFALFHNEDDLKRKFFFDKIAVSFKPRYNIAPSEGISAIIYHPDNSLLVLDAIEWGLVPFWSKDPSRARRMINARAETIDTKASFRAPFKRQRCLIPASGYYEWKSDVSGKVPYFVHMRDNRPFTMAGLWDSWYGVDGSILTTATIITTSAGSRIAELHHRMPVILKNGKNDKWLSPVEQDTRTLLKVLTTYNEKDICYHQVSSAVNNPKYDNVNAIKDVSP